MPSGIYIKKKDFCVFVRTELWDLKNQYYAKSCFPLTAFFCFSVPKTASILFLSNEMTRSEVTLRRAEVERLLTSLKQELGIEQRLHQQDSCALSG
jgi:hypothetical protein